jgi:hypothetical protein
LIRCIYTHIERLFQSKMRILDTVIVIESIKTLAILQIFLNINFSRASQSLNMLDDTAIF